MEVWLGVGSGVGARLAAGSGSITAKSLTADTEAGTPAPCMALAISSTCDFFLFFYRMILRSELHTGVGTRAYSRRKLFLFSTDDAELCEGYGDLKFERRKALHAFTHARHRKRKRTAMIKKKIK